jgi:hypothetical protein
MLGLKIKGQNYNSFLMQIAASNGTATNNYNFLGDIKAYARDLNQHFS